MLNSEQRLARAAEWRGMGEQVLARMTETWAEIAKEDPNGDRVVYLRRCLADDERRVSGQVKNSINYFEFAAYHEARTAERRVA